MVEGIVLSEKIPDFEMISYVLGRINTSFYYEHFNSGAESITILEKVNHMSTRKLLTIAVVAILLATVGTYLFYGNDRELTWSYLENSWVSIPIP